MEYILKVTENEIIVPKNIPIGTYRLVLDLEKVEGNCNLISIKELKNHIKFLEVNGRRSSTYSRVITILQKQGYKYLNELTGKNVGEFMDRWNIGVAGIATLIVICKEFCIDVKYDQDVFGKAVKEKEKSFVRI